jgi:hypothetical protein
LIVAAVEVEPVSSQFPSWERRVIERNTRGPYLKAPSFQPRVGWESPQRKNRRLIILPRVLSIV